MITGTYKIIMLFFHTFEILNNWRYSTVGSYYMRTVRITIPNDLFNSTVHDSAVTAEPLRSDWAFCSIWCRYESKFNNQLLHLVVLGTVAKVCSNNSYHWHNVIKWLGPLQILLIIIIIHNTDVSANTIQYVQ